MRSIRDLIAAPSSEVSSESPVLVDIAVDELSMVGGGEGVIIPI